MAVMKTIAMIVGEANDRRHEQGCIEWVALEAYATGREQGKKESEEEMMLPRDDMSDIVRPTRRTPEEAAEQRKIDAVAYVRTSILYAAAQRDMSRALEKLRFPPDGKTRMVVEVDGKHYAISQVDEVWSCNEVEVL